MENCKCGVKEGTYYTAFGLAMAGISSKAFDAPKNPYQYQGDYSEYDDETQWNEFELRNYDPQIGRFIQQDPYDQFPSPYTGMSNDPINTIDPSGGFGIDLGTLGNITGSVLGDRLLAAGAGALVGFGIDKLTGGKGGWGAAIGAGIGFGATFIPPFDIGAVAGAIGDAAQSLAIEGANLALNIAKQKGGGGGGGDYSKITRTGKLFNDETEAYKYLWDKSFGKTSDGKDEYRENGAFFTNKGVLVLPNVNNDPTTTDFDALKIRKNSSGQNTHLQFNGNWYRIKGLIHTHPHAGVAPDKYGIRAPSPEDFTQSKNLYIGMPAFVMSRVETFIYSGSKNVYSPIGSTKGVLSGKIKLTNYHY